MRVVVQGDPTTRSAAEDTVIGLLREWTGKYHLPGLCLMHVHVPTGARTREVDGILWTPHGLAVLEVKGFTSPQEGTLRIPANGPWQVDDQPAALHTLADTTPAEQCQTGVYAVRNTLHAAGVDPGFIAGLVALARPNQQLALGDTTRLPTGIFVSWATRTDLRRWAHHQRKRDSRPRWSADDVLAACAALDLSSLAPQRAELIADGFPDVITYSDRPRQHRPRATSQARRPKTSPQRPSASTATATRLAAASPPGSVPPAAPSRRPQPAPAPPKSRPSSRPASAPPRVSRRSRRTPVASIVGLVAILAGMLTVVGFVAIHL